MTITTPMMTGGPPVHVVLVQQSEDGPQTGEGGEIMRVQSFSAEREH
eukprot:CAMPEP_0184668814 /NCGR_PEP_ID=MMETSP0308-20130426/74200_1 /TAXON_ID=38269 /ORGANISM="Gloeochaete witrockiana, Strain SAG 46.84" /LENGTH=46 /DNA_ID= /DNA_START= /DNA_END= /DNA_ORIENTATION=